MTNKYDFNAWLDTKSPDTEYNFADSCGTCLMGQFMTTMGESWDFMKYQNYVDVILGGSHSVLSEHPQTFGAAKQRLQKLLDA